MVALGRQAGDYAKLAAPLSGSSGTVETQVSNLELVLTYDVSGGAEIASSPRSVSGFRTSCAAVSASDFDG